MIHLRHTLRLLSRRPLASAALIVSLALGIGANTAIFSLVRSVLLRPLPYHEPDRLVFAWRERTNAPRTHQRHNILTGTHVIEWHQQSTAFESVAAIESWSTSTTSTLDLIGADGAERLRGAFVTPNFFELLGVRAAVGRVFDSGDTGRGSPVAVISDAFWRRRFAADPSIVGQTVDFMRGRGARERYTVLGVLPPRFRFTYPLETEVWAILPWDRIGATRALTYQLVARLKPDSTASQAQAELTTIAQEIARRNGVPENRARDNIAVVETVSEHVAAEVRPGMLLLVAGAGVVMLIACVNVALLMLASVVDRRRELAVRRALGAGRSQIVGHLLGESAVVTGIGALIGVGLAGWLMPVLRALIPSMVPRGDEISLDIVVLVFAMGMSVVTALVCAFAPAWYSQRADVQGALRPSGGSTTGDRRLALSRRAIVVVQVAVVLVLLVSASLLLHSFWRMQQVDLGFAGEGVLTMEMRLLNPKYRQRGRIAEFQRAVLERIRALPGVEQASMTTAVPLRGVDFFGSHKAVGGAETRSANERTVDPEYFALMRVPVLAGRVFASHDDEKAPRVAVISETLARGLFGSANPVGRYLEQESGSIEVIGVVGDVRHADITQQAGPAVYFPRAQYPPELICLVIRQRPGVPGVAAAVRSSINAVDPEQPVERVTTLDRIVRESTSEERFYTVTTAAFASVAVLLALAGLSGVVSRTVTERVREIAVRIALGAEPRQMLRLTLAQGMIPVGIGIVAGVSIAWAASRVLQRFLFEISAADPVTYAAAVLLMASTAAIACYVPALRATRVEPMAALKSE